MVVVTVAASSALSVDMMRAVVITVVVVVAVVVDTPSPLASLDGVPGVAVGPEPALDCRRRRPDPFSTVLMLGGGRVRAVRGRLSRSTKL
jgi:hypothetical protein